MSLAFANQKGVEGKHLGPIKMGTVDITLDNSYPSNGEEVLASDLHLNGIHVLIPPAMKSGFVFEWDHVAGKIKAYYADYDTSGEDVLVEVPNTSTLLDAFVLRCFYIGY